MAVRTEWFVGEGGFDESFVNGFEDVDLCLRAREQGRAIAYVADARFAHYEAASAGRFAREAENELRFYARWAKSFGLLPRTERGAVGAIAVRRSRRRDALLDAAFADLEEALRAFGHPVVRGAIPPWRRLDRRFRKAATIAWFEELDCSPGIVVGGDASCSATICTHGAVELAVPWLPCASPQRAAALAIRRSDDPACDTVGVVGGDYPGIAITPETLLGKDELELACVVHLGLTDPAAFGNVLLAQAGIPAIVLERDELRALFAPDAAHIGDRDSLAQNVARMLADPALRRRYGELVAADARRRFSPRRSAIRVVDLLCAARYGLERPVP